MTGALQAAVQEPPKTETSGVLNKNTGFPEPLSPYSNTTLTHPDADTSQNACIESKDVPVERTHTRSASFQFPRLSKRSKENSGVIVPTQTGKADMLQDNAHAQYADGYGNGNGNDNKGQVGNEPILDGAVGGAGEQGMQRTESQRIEGAERKKGVLRKLHMQKS